MAFFAGALLRWRMSIADLFSRRRRQALGQFPDVYTYDAVPKHCRIQVVHVVREVLFESYYGGVNPALYRTIAKILRKEYGVFSLTDHPRNEEEEVLEFFLETNNVEGCLDVLELFCRVIHKRQSSSSSTEENEPVETAGVLEINQRLQEAGVGYAFTAGGIIRIDSELVHAEVVKPTLALLREPRFAGANEEFLAAHEHYRHGRQKEAVVEALKAFESTMKVICIARKWTIPGKGTAKDLISACISNGLIAPQNESYISATRSILESGLPTVRNKNGGHGQGEKSTRVPDHVVQFALHQCAAAILLLVKSDLATAT